MVQTGEDLKQVESGLELSGLHQGEEQEIDVTTVILLVFRNETCVQDTM